MRRKRMNLLTVLAALAVLLSGCMLKTVDQMYCLPRRSEEYYNLQSAMDQVMSGLDYCAPLQGENQQTVQMVDLTGDGQSEALVFAKGTGERPLKIFIFTKETECMSIQLPLRRQGRPLSKWSMQIWMGPAVWSWW